MLRAKNYRISKENIGCHEWIGLPVKVIESTDRAKIGIEGKVVDETKNLVVVDTGGCEKRLPKREVTFMVSLGDEKVLLHCNGFVQRPEDRIKYFGGKAYGMQ